MTFPFLIIILLIIGAAIYLWRRNKKAQAPKPPTVPGPIVQNPTRDLPDPPSKKDL